MTELDIKEIAKQIRKEDRDAINEHLKRMAEEFKMKQDREKGKGA